MVPAKMGGGRGGGVEELGVLVAKLACAERVPLPPVYREFLVGGREVFFDPGAEEALIGGEASPLLQQVELVDDGPTVGDEFTRATSRTSPLLALRVDPLEALDKACHR
jgi:hypothetical protein